MLVYLLFILKNSVPKILQTIVSCQTRQTMKVSFFDKIHFFSDHINMLLLTQS